MDSLLATIPGATHHDVAGMQSDVVPAGNGRIQRLIYPPGFRWSTHMKSHVNTERCMHAHVGFLAQGRVQGRYGDGCEFAYQAPQAVVIEPGHDAWVVGEEPAVLIQFDCQARTARHFGLPTEHRHREAGRRPKPAARRAGAARTTRRAATRASGQRKRRR
jgi:hypothetical protein